jgi:flagellar assembly protein FliH
MSSKLHRDKDLSTEPMRWTPVGSSASVYTSSQAGLPSSPEHGSRQLQARLQQLETERDQIAQAAYAKGRQEAELSARQQISIEISAVSATLARSIDEITGMRQRFRHEAEEDVVALAIAIARRVLHRELTTSPDALLGIAKAALEKIDLREVHRVRMHPDSAPLLQENLEKIGLPRRVEVIADPGLERGGVLLETTRGTLDASVETQLAEIERGFADLVRRV